MSLRIGNKVGVGYSKGAPISCQAYWTNKSLFFLDGTIVTVGADKYFKDRSVNARHFLITGYDFDSTWTKGFPYKSAATISAPAGDAVLIAADTGFFWYDSGGTPRNIPVISLFQNIDYANNIYCRHAPQVLDAYGVETYEPRVLEIFMAASALSAADIVKANTYFDVPTEVTANTKWVDTVNGSDSAPNDGTKAKPYATYAKALAGVLTTGTIYVKTGTLTATCNMANKGLNIIATGYTLVNPASIASFYVSANNSGDDSLIKGFITSASYAGFRCNGATAGAYTLQSNLLQGASNVYGSVDLVDGLTMKYNICKGKMQIKAHNTFDTNHVAKTAAPHACGAGKNLISTNNKYLGTTNSLIQRSSTTLIISLLGDYFEATNLLADEAHAAELVLTVNRCRIAMTSGFISLLNAASLVTFVFTNNTITQTGTTSSLIMDVKGKSITFTGNIVNGLKGYIIRATALAVGQTAVVSNNVCKSNYGQVSLFTDYTVTFSNNIITCETESGSIICTSSNYDNIPAYIHHNYIIQKTGTSPFVLLGTEYSTTIDGHLNGSEVCYNRFSGPFDWGQVSGPHAVFAWSQAANWHHNFVSGGFLSFVCKSNGGDFENKIHHNIIRTASAAFTIKGIHTTKIYNNTVVTAGGEDLLTETLAGGGDANATILKNNIIYRIDGLICIQTQNSNCLTGNESDYNIFFNNEGVALAFNVAVAHYTFAEWQALGYDANSYHLTIAQAAALFKDLAGGNYVPKSGGMAIGNGVTLDAEYDDGLDESTDWGDVSVNRIPVVVTKQQGASWDIGAFVH